MIDPGPLRPHLEWPARIALVVLAMVVGWVLAIVLVLAPHPLYAHYAALAHRPGGISALTDQQLAGGAMWVLGSLAYTAAAIVVWYLRAVRQVPQDTPTSSAALPPPEVLAAAAEVDPPVPGGAASVKLTGEATWPAGARPAPPIAALHDQRGHTFSLGALRGCTVAMVFFDSHCRQECPLAGRALAGERTGAVGGHV